MARELLKRRYRSTTGDASDLGVRVPIAVALWAALAAYAWGYGRLALFVTIVPVYYGLAFVVEGP